MEPKESSRIAAGTKAWVNPIKKTVEESLLFNPNQSKVCKKVCAFPCMMREDFPDAGSEKARSVAGEKDLNVSSL